MHEYQAFSVLLSSVPRHLLGSPTHGSGIFHLLTMTSVQIVELLENQTEKSVPQSSHHSGVLQKTLLLLSLICKCGNWSYIIVIPWELVFNLNEMGFGAYYRGGLRHWKS